MPHQTVRVRVIDAFTDEPFSGNPAGVVLLEDDEWPDAALMRRVAAELGHETAFVRTAPPDRADAADHLLRWFTPGGESNVCGHATLATTHALRSDAGRAVMLRYASAYGLLTASADTTGPITLDFPAARLGETAVPDDLSAALGADVGSATSTGALGDLVVTLADETTVRALRPDIAAVAAVIERHGLRGVIVTARADASSPYDFVSRFFAPASGIAEDPVTGSAHTALSPFWSARLGRTGLVGLQASERSGLVRTTLRDDRVELTGDAVTVVDGRLTLRQT